VPRTDTAYSGSGIDLAVQADGQLVVATVEGARIRLHRGGGAVLSAAAPGAVLGREMRVAVAPDGRIGVIGHVVTPSRAWVNLDAANPDSPWRPVESTLFGERYVAIAYRSGRFVWATLTAAANTLRIEDEQGRVELRPVSTTSQGVLYWADEPVLADARREVAAGPVVLHHGISDGDAALGTKVDPDTLTLVVGSQVIPIAGGNPQRPRLARHGATIFVAYQQAGAKVATLTPPYPVETPNAPTFAPFAHQTAIAWYFEDSKRPSVTPGVAPGDWSILIESGLRPAKPVILGLTGDGGEDLVDEWAPRWAQVRGLLISDEESHEAHARANLTALAMQGRQRMQANGLPLRPIYSYTADHVWTEVPGVDVVGVQLYPEPGESAAASEHRWRNRLQRAAGRRVVLHCGAYDRRPLVGITEAQLRACLPVYHRLAAETKAEALMLFAYGRQGGAHAFPALLQDLTALARAVVRTPTVDERPALTLRAPAATVRRFDGLLRPGWRFALEDTENPELGYGVDLEVRENGSIHATLRNRAGSNTTGALRKVI
jgi:hypothetical protein